MYLFVYIVLFLPCCDKSDSGGGAENAEKEKPQGIMACGRLRDRIDCIGPEVLFWLSVFQKELTLP